ncbi:MAG: dihydrofolate reductase family protein [Chloroflexota bacterium]
MSDSPVVRQLLPEPDVVHASELYATLQLPHGNVARPGVVLNFVSSVDGKIALGAGAAGIGSALDFALMKRIRAAADAVLAGASTLRAERVSSIVPPDLAARRETTGLPSQPLPVTLSRRLDLDVANRFFETPRRAVVFTTALADSSRIRALEQCADVVVAGSDVVNLADALQILRERYGVRSLVCEGGAILNQQLLDGDMIDEVFWTIAPRLIGGNAGGITRGDHRVTTVTAEMELVSLFSNGSEILSRYRIRRA